MINQNICNICGANYEYRNGRWFCPACGAYKQEELSNEEVTLLYNAAQKLRMSDFDEAEKEYSDIIEKFPKNANGYWGRLLSKYGIKYEEDFDGRKIPTCYATSIESVISDKDYKKAIELADEATVEYYKRQAEYIERVRKEWVEKAKKEKPYDIFLCYKDSDIPNGIDRTQDSIAVQDLYIHLTEQGYRVFFSRESLRGKVGEKYEPYIFNALSTAKVMLVYGSKPEYITSTWLKNEWTRYEKRIQSGEKKPNSLLVACDGFSPNELPKTLSSRQCFDATKRSFYSDLDALVKKIIKGEEKPKVETKEQPQKQEKSNKNKALFAFVAIVLALVVGLCILIPNLINKEQPPQGESVSSVTNSQYNSNIVLTDDDVPKGTTFEVEEVNAGVAERYVINQLNINKENYHLFDLTLKYNNEIVTIDGNAIVTMPIPNDIEASKAVVYYIGASTSEKMSSTVSDGKISFTTNHFSYYLIAEAISSLTPDDSLWTMGFYSNGGNGTMLGLSVGYNQSYTLPECAFTKDGYSFVGWSLDTLGSSLYNVGDSFVVTEQYTKFYAIWSANSNTLTFDSNGGYGSMDDIVIKTDETIKLPKNVFTLDGYTFLGWSDAQNGTVKYTDEQNFTMSAQGEVTLYAIWNVNENKLTLNSNDGTNNTTSINVNTGAVTTLPTNPFTRNGYTFLGWSSTANGEVEYANGANYTMGTSSSTIYAIWSANDNKIIFNANGGSGTMNAQIIKTNASANLNNCSFERNGYIFAGWSTTSTGDVVYTNGAYYTMGTNSEYTLYAIWTTADYKIDYVLNGGTNHKDNPVGYDVTDDTITLKNPSRQGYTFEGWYSNSQCTLSNNTISSGSTGDKTFYALWSANENTITFNSNGGNGGTLTAKGKTDATITLPSNTYTKEGYTFIGWSTVQNGSVEYENGASYKMGANSNYTLYAVWSAKTYTITYDTNGGTISGQKVEYTIETETFILVKPVKSGYKFVGWSGTDISGTKKDVTISKGSIGNRSYTANWEAEEYTVTLNANGGNVSSPTVVVTYNDTYSLPTPTRDGYTFKGWYSGSTKYDGGKWLNVGGLTLKAEWKANTNTKYTVNHHYENLNNTSYTVESEELYGTTDTTICPAIKSKEGFVSPSTSSLKILGNGLAVIDYYYQRATYQVSFVTNGGNNITSQTYKYGQSVSLPSCSRSGYTFGGWFTDVNQTISADDLIVITNCTVYAWWQEENKASDFLYDGDSSIVIKDYLSTQALMWIPTYIGGKPVTSVGSLNVNSNIGANAITSVYIPEKVTSISGFNSSFNLQTIEVSKNNTTFASIDGVLYSKDLKTIIEYPHGKQDVKFEIPQHVEVICKEAFGRADNLVEVIIPNSVIRIEEGAFVHSSKLASVTIQDNSKLTIIKSSAFECCVSLSHFTFGENTIIEELGGTVFYLCRSLETLFIPKTVTKVGSNLLWDSNTIINCEIEKQPTGWDSDWNAYGCTVNWFCFGDIWDGTTTYSFAGGTGAQNDPYLIATAEQLAFVATSVNQGVDTFKGKHLKLTTNIHLMGIEWTPIGTNYSFEGIFDGGGYTIYGLKVTDTTLRYSGLFGCSYDAKFFNVVLKEAYVNNATGYSAGLLVGHASSLNSSSLIENCVAEGSVILYKGGMVGGIVGDIYGNVSKSYANITVYGSAYDENSSSWSYVYVGGIAGSAHRIENCWSNGTITAVGGDLYRDVSYAGGIAGMAEYIGNSYSTADVSSNAKNYSYAGGIVGKSLYSTIVVENSFAAGNITGSSYSYHDVTCGRIIAEDDDGVSINNCYADSSQSIDYNSNTYGTLQFTQTLQSENFIYNTLGWNSDIWQINAGGFPTLK